MKSVLLRVENCATLKEIICSIFAIRLIGANLHLSLPLEMKKSENKLLDNISMLFNDEEVFYEKEDELVNSIKAYERVRFLTNEPISPKIYEALSSEPIHISSKPFVGQGRIEMLHYYIEQSISDSYHRYGNLGEHKVEYEETK
jgi:RHH-type proline utilization regulon transcriptional repressor/proline dehydrogenase/delta 1-pyrroline-5-carboxylate dehydrogenase